MRMMMIAVLTVLGTSSAIAASPDPYRWCAERSDGSSNCYFLTLEQCRAASRYCRENLFYSPAPAGQSRARSRPRR
jgi:hypothetical protein